jgi:hypothetical protein
MSLYMGFTSHRVHKAVLKTWTIIPVTVKQSCTAFIASSSLEIPPPTLRSPSLNLSKLKIVAIFLHKTNHRDKRRYFEIIVGATRSVNRYHFALKTRTNSCIFMSVVFCRHTNIEARFSALCYKTKRWRTCNAVTSKSGHAWFEFGQVTDNPVTSLLFYTSSGDCWDNILKWTMTSSLQIFTSHYL